MSLPDWMVRASEIPPMVTGKHRKSWVTRTLDRLTGFVVPAQSVKRCIELDPRCALPGFVALIVCATLLSRIEVLAINLDRKSVV